jgi:Fe-S cluster assembly protein SufD
MTAAATSWLGRLRAEAEASIEGQDWPSPEAEEWRKTDLGRFELAAYETGARGEARGHRLVPAGPYAGLLRFAPDGGAELALAEPWATLGVRLLPIDGDEEDGGGRAQGLLDEAFRSAGDRLTRAHFAQLGRGAFLQVPAGVRIDKPILVVFRSEGERRQVSPQLGIVLGRGAEATVITTIIQELGSSLLSNSRTDIDLAEGSSLHLFERLDLAAASLGFHNARARLGAASLLDRVEVSLGCTHTRTRMDCSLEGWDAEARLDGVYYSGSGQSADVGTIQRHVTPGGRSRAYYKGVAADGGRSAFQGLIDVAVGAKGTDAFLSNRNLLLGSAAHADSIPTLKIGNDDVKCSHGSATGRLSEEDLFYLRSRGFSRAEAREMLVVGFFEEILARAPETFREEALATLRGKLPDLA